MKIKALIILTPGFPANEGDTTCLPPMQTIVKAIAASYPAIKIIVITFQYPFRTDIYNWFEAQVHSFNGQNRGKALRLFTWLKVLCRLMKLHQQYELLGLLSFWLGECAMVGKLFARYYRLKHFIWLLGQDAKANNRYYYRVKPVSNNLIALSDFIADHFTKNYGISPTHLIPVGVDPQLFSPLPQRRTIDILGAGSLISLKQYQLFIEVVRYASYIFPDIKAVLCGEGPEASQLKQRIKDYNLENNIIFMGMRPHAEVLKLMQRSRIFLHTSAYEGYGAVIAEALYAGAQVISFCKPMHSNINSHFVVPDMQAMQKQVIKLLKMKIIDHQPILLNTVEDIAGKVMSLFSSV